MSDDFDYDIDIFKKKGKREAKDPIKLFRDTLSAISIDLGLSQDDISFMKNKLSNVKNVDMKNPTAFVLGYLATNKGSGSIKKSVINVVFEKFLTRVEDSSVKKADVVRYARLWTQL